ncbi:MAG: methyltransferase [Nanoarchaeota archaeon]|nr:methyltransferase domain-containing protein [Nanoarchaeota archaeon]MBU1631980.1 methyltransferase domain-containing protein [Nanoarchaeota archaeon]MBU1876090.1 methyltransferase domain-containing protein [Nanoarchaeota archaeon]
MGEKIVENKRIDRNNLILYLHGASAFQLLHAGVEFKIFDLLHEQKLLSLDQLVESTGLMKQPARTLAFGLTSLGLIEKSEENYRNCDAIEELFENKEYDLFKKMTLIQAHIMYVGQVDYVESLRQNRNVGVQRYFGIGKTIYERLNHDQKLKKVFYDYMEAYSAYALPHLLKNLDLSNVKNILDVGGGGGNNSIEIAKKYPNTNITLFDIPTAKSLAEENIRRNELTERIRFSQGDMFKDKFPNNQDCVVFIHQLVIWSLEENRILLEKAYQSLNERGQVVIFSSMSDDDEKGPLMAALDTVYFRSVAAGNGMIYPHKEYEKMLEEIGFKRIQKIKCDTWTPHGIVVGYK